MAPIPVPRLGVVVVLIADEVFLVGLDDRSGVLRLEAGTAGLGLAAGLLGELVLDGWLDLHEGTVAVSRRRHWPTDQLQLWVLGQIVAQRQHRQVRTWLAFLAGSAVDAVGDRLAQARVVRRERHRRLFGSRVVFMPVQANVVVWRSVRLAEELTGDDPLTDADAVLAGLVAVCGLAGHVLWRPESHDWGLARLRRAVRELPPALHELVAHAEAAVGDAVLAPR